MDIINNADSNNETALKRVVKALGELTYGSVTITVQDSRIVQIDKVEKIRIESKKGSIR